MHLPCNTLYATESLHITGWSVKHLYDFILFYTILFLRYIDFNITSPLRLPRFFSIIFHPLDFILFTSEIPILIIPHFQRTFRLLRKN